jgi:acyl-CoA thioester hydrolase
MSKPSVGETTVRVRYAETDQMGVVYHANYLIWFEVGRVELIRQMGLDYKSMEQDYGCGIAVVDASVRYKSPARYDEEITIRTRLAAFRGPVIRFEYTVLRAETILCEGATVHVVVDRAMKRASLPAPYASVFQQHLATTKQGEGL